MPWVRTSPVRRTQPETCLPYTGYVAVGPKFDARTVLSDIIPRVEADYGTNSLDPLIDLIGAFNEAANIETTHTGIIHTATAPFRLHTGVAIFPAGGYWRELTEVDVSSQNFATRALHRRIAS
jgi:hypothetical protein